MSSPVNLSQPLVQQLQQQASLLGISASELAETLINQSLTQLELSRRLWQSSPTVAQEAIPDTALTNGHPSNGQAEDANSTDPILANLISEIKARPQNIQNVHPPTSTLDDVLAAIEANPSTKPQLTADEWEAEWWPMREEMREQSRLRQAQLNTAVNNSASE